MSMSVTIIAWSLIPGIELVVFTSDGFVVKTRSKMLLFLVGWWCTWVKPCSTAKSIRAFLYHLVSSSCVDRHGVLADVGAVEIYCYDNMFIFLGHDIAVLRIHEVCLCRLNFCEECRKDRDKSLFSWPFLLWTRLSFSRLLAVVC